MTAAPAVGGRVYDVDPVPRNPAVLTVAGLPPRIGRGELDHDGLAAAFHQHLRSATGGGVVGDGDAGEDRGL